MQMSLDFSAPVLPSDANDYHQLPVSSRQLDFARRIASRLHKNIPPAALSDRRLLSNWIDAHKDHITGGRFSNYPSSKQVAFAERLARIKRRTVPRACFKDRKLMSHWIDSNR